NNKRGGSIMINFLKKTDIYLTRKFNILDFIIDVLNVILLTISVLAVFIAVIFRYVLHNPLGFTFGLSTFTVCWVIFLGLASAYKYGFHVAVDIFIEILPKKIQTFMYLITNLLVILILIALVYYG